MPPKIDNAPGLVWLPYKDGWKARWQCRRDLARKGFKPNSERLWDGVEPTEQDRQFIAARCQRLQEEMLFWARGGPELVGKYMGDVRSLIGHYETDPDSPYHKLRYASKRYYGSLTSRIMKDCRDTRLADLKARDILRLYEGWSDHERKLAMGHACVGMFRTLINFGATFMDDEECERLALILHRMRFKQAKARTSYLTAEQAIQIREAAHAAGWRSIALAQAIQFECILRQKDVIGEWVPVSEPGETEIIAGNAKWLRGIRWEEIDENLVLRHVTSKRQKPLTFPISEAPMVMEELRRLDIWPKRGPMIVHDKNGVPWQSYEFRRVWRKLADKCGIPANVRNMDSRAGAISEATDAGADLESVRHAATHSDIAMTQRYSRGDEQKTASVLRKRAAFRSGTDKG